MLAALEGLKARGLPWGPEQEFLFSARLHLERYLNSPRFAARKAFLQANTTGRGIVIPAGGAAQLGNALIAIHTLRNVLNSSMTVQVVYNGHKELHHVAELLQAFPGVELIDASHIPPVAQLGPHQLAARHHGWSFKTWALYAATNFREVLMMDADNLLLVPPEELFETHEWQQHGNLFWPDWLRGGEPNQKPRREAFTKLGLAVPWESPAHKLQLSVESGQVLLDRLRHADVLEWLWYLNTHHKELEALLHGDKDTFRMAFMLANKTHEFQQVLIPAGQALGLMPGTEKYHHRGEVQYMPDGRMAFHHRTAGAKLMHFCMAQVTNNSSCRVGYIASPLSPSQSIQCGLQAWVWRSDQLLPDAWSTLNCSYTGHPGATASDGSSLQETVWQSGGYAVVKHLSQHYWPGIRCNATTDKVPLMELSRFGDAGDRIDRAFVYFQQLVESHFNGSESVPSR